MVGIGPGGPLDRTRRAEQAISASAVIVGYSRYLDLVADLTGGKELVASGMTHEVERCRTALARAAAGQAVALVSSGDPGVYGMAGLMLELAEAEGCPVPIEIIPGVSAANATAARLGAPLMLDAAFISLSDLLVPWEVIRQRLEAVAAADLVVALYNPRSHKRVEQLDQAAAIFRRHRPGSTPVGIGTAVGTGDERVVVSDLDRFLSEEIGMRSTVVVGNRSSRRVGQWLVTPRGYRL
ncbi:MAG: precorrin-3B C(17)-methyltransferase [Myxococcaceae bacterium]